MARAQFVVLGLGRFGRAVAIELTRLGYEVLGVDRNAKVVQELADEMAQIAQADAADGEALAALGLAGFDSAVVALSEHLEASILAVVHLQRLGVTRILAKAANALHGSILERVGATMVAYPEHEMGTRAAHQFAAPAVLDYLDLVPGYGFARVAPSPAWVGRTLGELALDAAHGVHVVAVASPEGRVALLPDASTRLEASHRLIVAGLDRDFQRLPDPQGAGS